MRKLTYLVATSLDGYIAKAEGGDPTSVPGFFINEGDHNDALLRDYPEMIPTVARPMFGLGDTPNKEFDTVIEGRKSYENGLAVGLDDAYEHLRHLVFSRTMTEARGKVELVTTDPVEKVRELKREAGKKIWLVGGATLANAVRDEIDEIVVKMHPVVAGAGMPMFNGEFRPERYHLSKHAAYESGVLVLTYTRIES
ncbi:dihydrofolate reductase family protein [Amycolatopsis albispora]|uniref:Deaminase n=1 Tax=Amycolatopsis albispora TaxID=1804986 RepID=A0A344LFX6_9PSEU|nr:dihydrofolate reductase family protein [Amycolatopsis albispora]AXB46950.1 deaminase [Amycolatopsis albispora]